MGATVWFDTLDMETGARCVLRIGPPEADDLPWAEVPEGAVSPPLTFVLDDLLPTGDEPALAGDPVLLAGLAAATLRARSSGRLAAGDTLTSRLVLVGSRWSVLGSEPGPSPAPPAHDPLAALLRLLDAEDSLGLEGALMAGSAVDGERWLVARLATFLAHERHQLAARAAADRRADAAATLRALAARLAAALPPPPLAHAAVVSAGGTVRTPTGAAVWEHQTLDPRAARAATRALAGDPAASRLRRWLLAMGRLRVDRALLARR